MSVDLAALAKRGGGFFDGIWTFIPGPGKFSFDRSLSVGGTPDGRLHVCSCAGDDAESIRGHLIELGLRHLDLIGAEIISLRPAPPAISSAGTEARMSDDCRTMK